MRKRKPKTRRKNRPVVGVAWYPSAEEWQLMRELAPDAERLESSYQEWVEMVESTLKQLHEVGFFPVKVDLEAEAFVIWCRENARELDGPARAAYASHLLQERHESLPQST